MRLVLTLALALLAPLAVSAQVAEPPVPRDRLGPDAVRWGAASAFAETRSEAPHGEWVAILDVYTERWRMMVRTRPDLTWVQVARTFSWAIRRHRAHRRPWVFHLRLDLERPRHWTSSTTIPWEWRERDRWGRAVATTQAYLEGLLETPCPDAINYGSRADGRPEGLVRARCSIPTETRFWARAPRRCP